MAEVIYLRQKQALGLGHAVLCAQHWVNDEPFGVSLADELIIAEKSAMQQLKEVHEQTGSSVIGLMRVPKEQLCKYGVVDYIDENGLLRLTDMVEKPAAGEAPSDMAIVGRYIFTPRLMDLLQQTKAGAQGEIQLTDAMAELAKIEPVYGVLLDGQRFDAGNPEGFLLANTVLGLQHKVYGKNLRLALKKYL